MEALEAKLPHHDEGVQSDARKLINESKEYVGTVELGGIYNH
jgi:hypothetical protein